MSDGVSAFHYDFHKNLIWPKLSCQESYYASKLTGYAFGVRSGETGKGTVYIWPEIVAPKHPDTLLSCLNFHLTEVEEEKRSWNIFWADNARSQNKNYTVVMYLENLVASGVRKRVDYKFLIAGHSFGPVDRDAGCAEGVLRREQSIETPSDYINLMNSSTLSPKITWVEMRQHQFKCYSRWLRAKYTENRKDINGQPFLFSQMSHFNFGVGERVDPLDGILKTYSHPDIIWMRKTLDPREEPIELDLRKKSERQDTSAIALESLNNEILALSSKKRENLLMLSKYLSPVGTAYYRNIIEMSKKRDNI